MRAGCDKVQRAIRRLQGEKVHPAQTAINEASWEKRPTVPSNQYDAEYCYRNRATTTGNETPMLLLTPRPTARAASDAANHVFLTALSRPAVKMRAQATQRRTARREWPPAEPAGRRCRPEFLFHSRTPVTRLS